MINSILQPAYLLHAWPYRETSLLADFFTMESGRINAVVKGAKRHRSVAARLMHPFIPLAISWSGRGHLHTLTKLEANGVARQPHGSSLISGMYINELIMRLCKPGDPHPELFTYYKETLQALAELDYLQKDIFSEQKLLRVFEKKLLQEIGYALPLTSNTVTGEFVEAEREYYFDFAQGPCLLEDASRVEQPQARAVFNGNSLIAIAADDFSCKQYLLDAKRLMRQVLTHHLGDKPLATRKLVITTSSR